MKRASHVAIRLGPRGHSLRRRIDKVAVLGTAGLLAVFLAGAPAASIAAARAVTAADAAQQHDQRTWRMVQAVLLQGAPVIPGSAYGPSEAWARWASSAGHPMEGLITINAGAPPGTRTRIWITPSGRWAGTRLSAESAQLRVILAAAGAPIGLALALSWLWGIFQGWLDRRRLASWEASWETVGPEWTRQFRARGI